MCYFGIPRHTQSLTAYKMLTQYFGFELHCGNSVCIVSYSKNRVNHKYDCTDKFNFKCVQFITDQQAQKIAMDMNGR